MDLRLEGPGPRVRQVLSVAIYFFGLAARAPPQSVYVAGQFLLSIEVQSGQKHL